MKKTPLVIGIVILLVAISAGIAGVLMTESPEYNLKEIFEDVDATGMEGLYPHLTEKAQETVDEVSSVAESDFFNTVMNFFNKDEYISVLTKEVDEIQWGLADMLKSKDRARATLSFNYKDKLVGTIGVHMLREEGEWKISGLDFPQFDYIKW